MDLCLLDFFGGGVWLLKKKGEGGGGWTSIERRLQCLPATKAEIEQPVFGLVRWFSIR